jgi:hypothetical protein
MAKPGALHIAVFDRVEVNVVEMPREIVFVTQRVFPITALPDPALALTQVTNRDCLALGQCAGEIRLDQPLTA